MSESETHTCHKSDETETLSNRVRCHCTDVPTRQLEILSRRDKSADRTFWKKVGFSEVHCFAGRCLLCRPNVLWTDTESFYNITMVASGPRGPGFDSCNLPIHISRTCCLNLLEDCRLRNIFYIEKLAASYELSKALTDLHKRCREEKSDCTDINIPYNSLILGSHIFPQRFLSRCI